MTQNYHHFLLITPPPLGLEMPGMATALEEYTRSPTHLKIPRERILQAENKPTNEPRHRGEEEEADYTKTKAVSASTHAPCIAGVSQET
jgi:hypothetical protein